MVGRCDGLKEAGQGPLLPVAPALVAALHDALGVWIDEVPVTPEKVLRALDQRERGGGDGGEQGERLE